MEPIFTDKQLNNMSREDLISLMKIVPGTDKEAIGPMEFLVSSILQISAFILAIFIFVGLAYYLVEKSTESNIAETLRNDTLV